MIEDITDMVARQREERAQREVLRAVRHITHDRRGFMMFLSEATRPSSRRIARRPSVTRSNERFTL